MALSCSIKLVNAIVSAEKRETPITDVSLTPTSMSPLSSLVSLCVVLRCFVTRVSYRIPYSFATFESHNGIFLAKIIFTSAVSRCTKQF